MKSPNGLAMTAALAFPDAPNVHLLLMAGLIFLTGLAGVGTVVLLLLLAPIAALLIARPRSTKPAEDAATPGAVPLQRDRPDGDATRLPLTGNRSDEAA